MKIVQLNIKQILNDQINIVVVVPMNMNKNNIQSIIEISFEKFQTQNICICRAPLLSLFSEGLTSGLCIDSGEQLN